MFDLSASLSSCPFPIIPLCLSRAKEAKKKKEKKDAWSQVISPRAWEARAILASPQTSAGVRLSRIHFSPTVRGGEINA